MKNIFKENELNPIATCTNFARVQNEGGREIERTFNYYNLDIIISIGYRVKSSRGIAFRRRATSILKDYIMQGYVVNEKSKGALEGIIGSI